MRVRRPHQEHRKKKKTQAKWGWHQSHGEQEEDNRPFFIIFILGGISFSEMRSIYKVPENRKVQFIIGGSSVLTPAKFVRGIADLTRSEYTHTIHKSEGNAISDQEIQLDPDTENEEEVIDIEGDEEEPTNNKLEIEEKAGSVNDCVLF